MTTVIIKSNAVTVSDILVKDLGIIIPQAGGSDTFTSTKELAEISTSTDLVLLATDDAFGVGDSTLTINDGSSDIPQAGVESFLDNLLFGQKLLLRYTYFNGVPDAGTRYLRTGNSIPVSKVGERLTANATLVGLSIFVDDVDNSQDFNVEFIKNTSGSAVVIATLILVNNTKSNSRRDLNAVILSTDEVGVRIVRATGSLASDFKEINVLAEISII